VENDESSLQCDELLAKLEQRVTQLESVLTQYDSSRYDEAAYTYVIYDEPAE
jgi:hypothetical protein